MEINLELDTFYNKINLMHPNLEFTLERPDDNKLLFLDIEIKNIYKHKVYIENYPTLI